MRSLPIVLLATTAFVAPLSASAQSVDDAGAVELEDQVAGFVEDWFLTQPLVSYQWDGDLEAIVGGDSYILSIPPLRFQIDNDNHRDLPEVFGELPAFEATVTPLDNGWQLAEWSYPSPIVLFDPRDDDERVTIRYASEDNSVVIAPEYGVVMDADVAVNDITATLTDVPIPLTIEEITIASQTDESGEAPHTYDASSIVTFTDLDFDAGREGRVTLQSLELSGTTERQRFDLLADFEERLRGLDPESEEYVLAFIDILRETEGEKWLGEVDFNVALEEFAVATDDATGSIEAFVFGMTAEDLDEDVAQLGFRLEAIDFSSTDIPPEFFRVVPTHATLEIEAADTPIDAISQELYAVLGDAPSDEELFGPKGRRANVDAGMPDLRDFDPIVFFDIVMNSETQVIVEDLFIEAPIGYVTAEGTIDPDPQAAMQVVASIDLAIAGLPEMIAFAQETGGEAAQAAGLASALSAMGRDGVDEEGVAIKEFDLELTAAGQVLLNGNDMSAMMGMFQ